MQNPTLHAFFVGRALAEVLGEKAETGLTEVLSELGKFDAEQRERIRQFSEEVVARAEREANAHAGTGPAPTAATPSNPSASDNPEDLQATIDELRASIASVRTELNHYNNHQSA